MKKIFLPSLANAINAYLKLDPESQKRLQKLRGKVITLELLPFHLVFQCFFKESGLEIAADETLPAETKISGTPLQLCGVMLTKENRNHFFADDVAITGDAALGQQVIELFDDLQIDWEEHMSRFIGDVPAYHIGRFVSQVGNWFQNTEKSFAQDVTDYIHEEVKWFPSREALTDFFNEVDTLRMDVDRIAAKINNLQTYLTEDEDSQ